jgi:hypothetical protein
LIDTRAANTVDTIDLSAAAPRTADSQRGAAAAAAIPFWLWWNLVSADAPAVAIAWAALFARSRGVVLPFSHLAALALVVWLIYLMDRILDALRASDARLLKERHLFSARHRNALLSVIALGGAAAAWLVRDELSAREIHAGLVLSAIVGLYMLAVHLPGHAPRRLLPKEISVGMIFAAGTMLPVWTHAPVFAGAPAALAITRWTLFALLCSLNCVAIECWENACEQSEAGEGVMCASANSVSANGARATRFVAWCDSRLSSLAAGLIALCFVAAAAWRTPAAAIPATTIGAAALLTWLLNSQRARLSATALRVLADGALLVPALVALIRF